MPPKHPCAGIIDPQVLQEKVKIPDFARIYQPLGGSPQLLLGRYRRGVGDLYIKLRDGRVLKASRGIYGDLKDVCLLAKRPEVVEVSNKPLGEVTKTVKNKAELWFEITHLKPKPKPQPQPKAEEKPEAEVQQQGGRQEVAGEKQMSPWVWVATGGLLVLLLVLRR